MDRSHHEVEDKQGDAIDLKVHFTDLGWLNPLAQRV